MRLAILLLLSLTGCVSVTRGLHLIQDGLAIVDEATDKSADGLLKAVVIVRQFCDAQPDPDKCMERLGVTPDMLDTVVERAEDLDRAYQQAADAAKMADDAWTDLRPQLEAAEAAAKQVKDGLGQ